MTDRDEIEKMLGLLKEHSGFSNLECVDSAHVVEFHGVRCADDGTEQAVTVKIRDYGRGHPSRYLCVAEDANGRTVSGNREKSLETCLLCIRWNDWK